MSFTDLVTGIDRAVQGHLGSVAVVYQPEFGDPVLVQGMFDEQYLLVDEGNAGVEQRGPAVFLRLEDLPIHPDEDDPVLVINGTGYQIRERQPDGLGGIRILLHVVA